MKANERQGAGAKFAASALIAAALLTCSACSSGGTGSSAKRAPGSASRPHDGGSQGAGVHGSGSESPVGGIRTGGPSVQDGGDGGEFCAIARHADIGGFLDGKAGFDASKVLATLDRMDTVAATDIKSDFDAFVEIERDVLSPGPTGAARDLDAATARSLKKVATYLTDECGLG